MTTASKTIGPMMLVTPKFWGLGRYCLICKSELNRRFNVPQSAEKLWATITSNKPKHNDAVRIRSGTPPPDYKGFMQEYRRIDGQQSSVEMIARACHILEPFGNDCYATIYYE